MSTDAITMAGVAVLLFDRYVWPLITKRYEKEQDQQVESEVALLEMRLHALEEANRDVRTAYLATFASLSALELAAEVLWEEKAAFTQQSIDLFARQLGATRAVVWQHRWAFGLEIWDELKGVLDQFKNFSLGKQDLLSAKLSGHGLDSMELADLLKEQGVLRLQYSGLMRRILVAFGERLNRTMLDWEGSEGSLGNDGREDGGLVGVVGAGI